MAKDLTFDTPVFLKRGFDLIETEEFFLATLMEGYKEIAHMVEVGGSILSLETEVRRVSELSSDWFPPEVPPDTLVYSAQWTAGMTLGQALLFAWKDGGPLYWSDTLDEAGIRESLGCFPEEDLELLLDEIMEGQGEAVESWRAWKEKKEEDSY